MMKPDAHNSDTNQAAQADELQPDETAQEQRGENSAEANDTDGTGQNPGSASVEDTPEAKAQKTWEMLVRTTADFDNYKKRSARERAEAVKYANEALLEKLITVLDNFDMALAAAQSAQAQSVEALKTGIAMIHQQLRGVLAESGLTEVDATGQAFDPNLHEAISQQENSELPEGHVIQQIRKGYRLRERLLRPASVIVSKKPAE